MNFIITDIANNIPSENLGMVILTKTVTMIGAH